MSSVPISGLDHQQALELLWAGHRAIDPIYCEDGGIIATFGLYRAALNPLYQLALLYAADPEDLRVDFHPSGTHIIDGRDMSIGLDRHYPGMRWQGQSRNAEAVTVIHARETRTHEPWIMSEIERFETARTHDVLNYGFLKRLSPTRWVSQAIVYELEPEKDTGLYTLRCILAPSKGWDLLHLNGWQNRLIGLTAICKPRLSMSEAEKLITRDFRQRVRSVMRGLDHFDKPREVTQAFETVTTLGLISRFIRRKKNWLAHSIAEIKLKSVLTALPALLVMLPFKGTAIVLAALSKMFDIGLEGGSKELRTAREQDISDRFWRRGIKTQNIPDQYEPIDVEILERLYFLGRDELNAYPKHGGVTQNLIETVTGKSLETLTALEYILGTLHGPPGSIVEFDMAEGRQPRLIVKQPNGMTIEHFPLLGCALARLSDDRQAVPSAIRKLFHGHEQEILLIDDYSEMDFHHGTFSKVVHQFLTEAEADVKREEWLAVPLSDRLRPRHDLGNEKRYYEESVSTKPGLSRGETIAGAALGGAAIAEAAKALLEELPEMKP